LFETSYIELSRSALKRNYEFLQSVIGPKVTIASVVKGNAYGHGISPFVEIAEDAGIGQFYTYSAYEAFRVFKAATKKPIITIMGSIDDDAMEWAIENGVEFFLFEKERLNKACEIARAVNKKAIVHIELETGLNRTGFDEDDIDQIVKIIKENKKHLDPKGLCTHFAGTESVANYLRIQKQMKRFKDMRKIFNQKNIKFKLKHVASSSAAIRFPQMRMNLVRSGTLLFGFWPTQEVFVEYLSQQDSDEFVDPLRGVLTWKSKVIHIKNLKRGEYIGYGYTYQAKGNCKIALVGVGYSNGYARSLSSNGHVLINGQFAEIVGNIGMNVTAVNITNIPDVEKGAEVVLIGSQGENKILVSSFSEFNDQLNYELVARLPSDIPRIIVD
jgi:alanine racemase